MKRNLISAAVLLGTMAFAGQASASLIIKQDTSISGSPSGIQDNGTGQLQFQILNNQQTWHLLATNKNGDHLLELSNSSGTQTLSGVMDEFIYFFLNVGQSGTPSDYWLNPVSTSGGDGVDVSIPASGEQQQPTPIVQISETGSLTKVPEPSTLALMTLGLLAFLGLRNRKKTQ